MMAGKIRKRLFPYLIVVIVGLFMVYPLLFMFFGTFKTNAELFGSTRLLPQVFDFVSYTEGWQGPGQFTYATFFLNTFRLVIPTVFFAILSSVLVSYGFSRFRFPGKSLLFMVMLSTLMLPSTVTVIPRFILFRNLDWINSYLPFVVPALFAGSPFFIFMMVQFFRGIPKELDESACIDGCNTLQTLIMVLLPLLKPAIFSIGIFQFIWLWNDFFNALIFINEVRLFPISLALRMSMDASTGIAWNQVLAMSFLSILPSVFVFFFAQKYFVEGITTTGLKG